MYTACNVWLIRCDTFNRRHTRCCPHTRKCTGSLFSAAGHNISLYGCPPHVGRLQTMQNHLRVCAHTNAIRITCAMHITLNETLNQTAARSCAHRSGVVCVRVCDVTDAKCISIKSNGLANVLESCWMASDAVTIGYLTRTAVHFWYSHFKGIR